MHCEQTSSWIQQQETNAYEHNHRFCRALNPVGTCPAFAGFGHIPESRDLVADEMGLGKTVQMLAVIVSSVCTRREAELALSRAAREQNNAELHVLGSEARRARQEAAEEARRLQDSPGPESGPSATAVKKARKIVWQVERPGLCLLLQLYTQAAQAMTMQHDLDTPEHIHDASLQHLRPYLGRSQKQYCQSDQVTGVSLNQSFLEWSHCVSHLHSNVSSVPDSAVVVVCCVHVLYDREFSTRTALLLGCWLFWPWIGTAHWTGGADKSSGVQPCGAGPDCTCAMCKKAGKQQVQSAP